jgi:ABC-2 type transport system permease protein
MRLFLVQLGWELRRLATRPHTWLAFALSLIFELAVSTLLKVPSARADIARDLWKLRAQWNEAFSGLTTAVHVMEETYTIIGSFGLALVAAVIVAGEDEDGTLRMVLCRPVSRTVVLAQKGIACVLYAAVLTGFIAFSTLAICLIFEGPGNLVLLAPHEGVMGSFLFTQGLQRYVLAVPLMWFSAASGLLWAFLFSCSGMKPAAATILSLALFATDDIVRTVPETAAASPYCVTTRMVSWRQVFNYDIPWARIQRNYTQLAEMDGLLIAGGWLFFRRRECKQ